MRLTSILDLGTVFGGRHPQSTHDSSSKYDRLGFLSLSAAVQMDHRGFLYAPLKHESSRSQSPAK